MQSDGKEVNLLILGFQKLMEISPFHRHATREFLTKFERNAREWHGKAAKMLPAEHKPRTAA